MPCICKMKRILLTINTYSQLVVSIQMRYSIWKNDLVDVIISDQSNDSKRIADNLSRYKLFNKVVWIKNNEICSNTKHIYYKIIRWFCILFGWHVLDITNNIYDELLFYNADAFVHGLFATLIKKNGNMITSRYEEGILSYVDSQFLNNSKLKYANNIRKCFGKRILENEVVTFYCFYPEFYKGELRPICINKIINNNIMGSILKKIFDVNDEKVRIKEKYIFFTSIFDFQGSNPIGEYNLVLKIAEIVGKDNLLVKTHPRDKRLVYEQSDLHVYEHSSIPWEAIQFNNDFSDKVLLTVNSSSVLTANLMVEDKAKSVFLYKCCNYEVNDEAVEAALYLENLLEELPLKKNMIKIENSLDEFIDDVRKGEI